MSFDLLLPVLLGGLLVFMFWSSRRRNKKMKADQEEKARQTVPGAEVLLQGGLYGTIVEFDPENLDQPAIIELAPGVEIKVHSQAILRVVTPSDDEVDVLDEHEVIDAEEYDDDADEVVDPDEKLEADAQDGPVTEPGADAGTAPDAGTQPKA